MMRRNYYSRSCGAGRMISLLNLFLFITATFWYSDDLCSKGNSNRNSFEGSVTFASAFCDTTLAEWQSRHRMRKDRDSPKNSHFQGIRSLTPRHPTREKLLTGRTACLEAAPLALTFNGASEESLLLFWVATFSFSHIGMSAIRQTLITDVFGNFLANYVLGIVGTGKFRLPDFWPGDSSGTNELFPDIETTGRQFYRMFYTMISFLTLGSSFSIYLGLRSDSSDSILPATHDIDLGLVDALGNSGVDGTELTILLSYAVATLSGAFSLASLVNASPLGLMPSFRQQDDEGSGVSINKISGVPTATAAGDTLLGITRDDGLKFDPKGLTRITRHPLILPVFPWGIATSVLAGGRLSDAILFCGLSLYSIAGCYCQDLRVLRQEGSVGTVFFGSTGDSGTAVRTKNTINQKLRAFYDKTSFLPFQALLDGRQSWVSMVQEFPILPFLIAIPSAFAIQTAFLRFLGVHYNIII